MLYCCKSTTSAVRRGEERGRTMQRRFWILGLTLCLLLTACAAPATAPVEVEPHAPETLEEPTTPTETAPETPVEEDAAPEELEEPEQAEVAAGEPVMDIYATPDSDASEISMYPYYDILGSTRKQLYREIYDNVLRCVNSFRPAIAVTGDDVAGAFLAVYYDHPELFWWECTYTYEYTEAGQVVELFLTYNDLVHDIPTHRAQIDGAIDALIAGASGNRAAKARHVYNELLARCSYNVAATHHQNIYSAAVLGQSVCSGYAKAYQYALQKLGIPCYYCTGVAIGQDHAWNVVYTEGYYNVDATMGDTDPDPSKSYFHLTDQNLSATHTRNYISIYLPEC